MRNKKVVFWLSVVAVMVIISLLASCTTSAPSPTPSPSPTSSPTASPKPTSTATPTSTPTAKPSPTAEPVKPITLRAVSYQALTTVDLTAIGFKKYMDLINERSKGELKINYIGAAEAIPAAEQMEALRKGVVDLIHTASYHKTVVPEARAIEQSPLTPWEERKVGFFDLLSEATKKKLGTMPLGRTAYDLPFYVYTNVKVQKIDDFKGLKFRSNVSYEQFFAALGIVRVEMPSQDIYTAMERGLVVGYSNPKLISRASLQEVTKYRVDHGFWNVTAYTYIGQQTFEKLPAHLQKLLMDTAIEIESTFLPPLVKQYSDDEDKRQLAGGMQFIKLTPPDDKKFVELAYKANWDQIAKEAPAVVDKLKQLLAK